MKKTNFIFATGSADFVPKELAGKRYMVTRVVELAGKSFVGVMALAKEQGAKCFELARLSGGLWRIKAHLPDRGFGR